VVLFYWQLKARSLKKVCEKKMKSQAGSNLLLYWLDKNKEPEIMVSQALMWRAR